MKRFLTFEETNAIKAGLELLIKKIGEDKIEVANYSGSWPNDPEKAKRYMTRGDLQKLIDFFDECFEDYDELLKNFVLSQPDDFWDHLEMVKVLMRGLDKILGEVENFEALIGIEKNESFEESRLYNNIKGLRECVQRFNFQK